MAPDALASGSLPPWKWAGNRRAQRGYRKCHACGGVWTYAGKPQCWHCGVAFGGRNGGGGLEEDYAPPAPPSFGAYIQQALALSHKIKKSSSDDSEVLCAEHLIQTLKGKSAEVREAKFNQYPPGKQAHIFYEQLEAQERKKQNKQKHKEEHTSKAAHHQEKAQECTSELENIDTAIAEIQAKLKDLSFEGSATPGVQVDIPPDLAENTKYTDLAKKMAAIQAELDQIAAAARKEQAEAKPKENGNGEEEQGPMEVDMDSWASTINLPPDLPDETRAEILKRISEAPPPQPKRQKQSASAFAADGVLSTTKPMRRKRRPMELGGSPSAPSTARPGPQQNHG